MRVSSTALDITSHRGRSGQCLRDVVVSRHAQPSFPLPIPLLLIGSVWWRDQ
jgi:hypothetical protein